MVHPAAALRDVAAGDAVGSVWRGPLALACVWGVLTSALASGTLNVRLIADGAMSFAFVPLVQIAGLALAMRLGNRRAVPFSRAVDLFFAGNAPWLVWMAAQAGIYAL